MIINSTNLEQVNKMIAKHIPEKVIKDYLTMGMALNDGEKEKQRVNMVWSCIKPIIHDAMLEIIINL